MGFLEVAIEHGQLSKEDARRCVQDLRKHAENDRKAAKGEDGCALMANAWDALADAMEHPENSLP